MTIAIVCPNCNGRFQVADAMAGKHLKCRTCSSPISVDGDRELRDLDAVAPVSEAASPPRRVRKRRSSGVKIWAAIFASVGGLLLIAGVIVVVYIANSFSSLRTGIPNTGVGAKGAPRVADGDGVGNIEGTVRKVKIPELKGQVVTLSNLRRVAGITGANAYSMDVSYDGQTHGGHYSLVMDIDGSRAVMELSPFDLRSGGLSVEERSFGPIAPRRGRVTAWIEFGPPRIAWRVSNVVTLD